jgi:processive 1,2-diacylglycerol beta-glucosyltransferase
LIVLGWIDYVQEAMAASDIVITKPGGSTITECLTMNLPMIFFSIIPGQERQNAEIISKSGLGFILERPKDIKEKILYLRNNPRQISAMKNKIVSFRILDSNRNILALIK